MGKGFMAGIMIIPLELRIGFDINMRKLSGMTLIVWAVADMEREIWPVMKMTAGIKQVEGNDKR